MADNKKSVSKRNTLPKKTHYHAAFLSGLEILFWPYRNQIIMVPETALSTEGIRMDTLLLKKEPSLEMDSGIARIFREHNIIEYKSFNDALTIDVFAKVMAYAHLYKSQGSVEVRHAKTISEPERTGRREPPLSLHEVPERPENPERAQLFRDQHAVPE